MEFPVKVNIDINTEPVTKLLDMVQKTTGTLYKPRAIRKQADAEAYALETTAHANAKALVIEGGANSELVDRAKNRLVQQELQRQENLENIIEQAIPELDVKASVEEVTQDWSTRFFKKAADVSDTDMQSIWAKILAGEVSNPGQVSLRTLETVSNVSKQEAEAFNLICSMASANMHIWKIGNDSSFDKYGLGYAKLMMLKEAGLIHDSDTLHASYSAVKIDGEPSSLIHIGDNVYIVKSKADTPTSAVNMAQVALTTAGSEICKIINAERNEQYFTDLIASKEKDYVVSKMG